MVFFQQPAPPPSPDVCILGVRFVLGGGGGGLEPIFWHECLKGAGGLGAGRKFR